MAYPSNAFPSRLQSTDGLVPSNINEPKRTKWVTGEGFNEGNGVVGKDIGWTGRTARPYVRTDILVAPWARDVDPRYPSENYTSNLKRFYPLFINTEVDSGGKSAKPANVVLDLQKLMFQSHVMTAGVEMMVDEFDVDENRRGAVGFEGKQKRYVGLTPKLLVKSWKFAGYCHTEPFETSYSCGDRKINVVTVGEYKLPNLWGEVAIGPRHLWFLARWKKVSDLENYFPMSTGAQQWVDNNFKDFSRIENSDEFEHIVDAKGKFHYVPHLEPIVTERNYVPMYCEDCWDAAKREENRAKGNLYPECHHGQRHYCIDSASTPGKCVHMFGYPIYVGFVERNTNRLIRVPGKRTTNMLQYDTLPKMDAYVDVGGVGVM